MTDDATARVTAVRDELAQTLDEISDRLSPRRVPEEVRKSWRRDPVPWIIGGGVVALLVAGAVAWAFLSDD